ncbi:AAA family ATPase [Clostridium sporogenes]|uniref:AAA family ATPase n=1 Tax=Clostridium sporogenes TaxID=1509 RepID=UPI0013D3C3B4|nr:AAA family ATPase [Clostridium sporogenes]NFQ68080.1 hypothetical protein [Clostridium sporogenes]
MKINEVKIKNFRGFGENNNGYYIFSDLAKYKFIIFNGFNGFGKTSFFDSIEWCITGKISRIQDKAKILLETNLKQSANLKFANEDERAGKVEKKHRNVEVIIIFDDGTSFKRTSERESLYPDLSKIEILDENLQHIDEKTFFEKLIKSNKLSAEELISTNILGQERINEFLRSTNPKDRTKKLMNLIGHKTLVDIVEKSNSTNFNRLNSTIDSFNKAKEKMDKNEEQLGKLFEIKEWGDIEQYIPTVQNLFKQLLTKNQKFQFKDEWEIREVIKDNKQNDNETVFNTIELLDKKYKYLEEKQKEFKNNINMLKEKRLVDDIINKYETFKGLGFIKENNVEQLTKDKKNLEKIISKYKEDLTSIHNKIESNSEFRGMWNELENYIYIEKNTRKIKNNIWMELKKVIIKYEKFINDNKKEDISGFKTITDSNQLDIELWNKRELKHKKYTKILKFLGNKIRNNQMLIKKLSDINESYKVILLSVQKYILEQEKIDECPICLNKNFSYIMENPSNEDENIKDKLLKIIEYKITNEDPEIKLLVSKNIHIRNRFKYLLNKYEQNLIEPIKCDLKNIKEEYNKTFETFIEYLKSQKLCVKKHINYFENKLLNIEDDFKEYTRVKIHLTKNLKKFDINKLDELYIEKYKIRIERQIEILRSISKARHLESYNYNQEELLKYSSELNQKIKTLNFENGTINILKKKDNELKSLLSDLNSIVKYFPDNDDKEILKSYFTSQNKKKKLEYYATKLKIIKEDKDQIQKNSEFIQNNIINKILQKNEMVNWIFNKINPHPFFNSVEFDYVKNEGTNFKYKNDGGNNTFDIYLDHIFSSAQLNVLALSIFLGLGLTQKCSNLDQLFLDDPIQSMDDINILSYIDLMRAIIDSNLISKNIIISTHDDNFAKLLSIKMRNKEFKVYNFISYGKEGPVII